MVSSKCAQALSPSPFRFLAELMPPCAQTECDRLTGTMEKRSTLPPASAILITADRPASPPPTTMILGVAAAAMNSSYLIVGISIAMGEVSKNNLVGYGGPCKHSSDS